MKLTFDIDISPEREKWATIAFQSVVESKETEAATVEEYIASILKPSVEAIIGQVTDSWKPVEAAEVVARRDAAADLISEIPAEKLAVVEAAIEAALAAEVEPKP